MALHLTKAVIRQLRASENAIMLFSDSPVVMKGIDLDAMHRKFRILAKHGLMSHTLSQGFHRFVITPKGRSLLRGLSHNNE